MWLRLLSCLSLLAACGEPVTRQARILTMGDSLLSWNRGADAAVSDQLERLLQTSVVDRSVPAARMLPGLPGLSIPRQYRPGNWDWIILNGGGNDLWLGCGCVLCDGSLRRMVSEDGRRGAIPKAVARLRATGAQVIYVGYMRSPGIGSAIEHCRDEGAELEARLLRMARADSGVHFLSIADMVPYGDRSFHSVDRIHPSAKAGGEIARRIMAVMEAHPEKTATKPDRHM